MRILFVDDDTHLLRGLRRMLHRQLEWRMEFEESAEAALTQMGANSTDLLLTDMRMPGTDGMDLLRETRSSFPGVFRGVLSGQVDRDAVLQAMPLAHHFLRKPCAPVRICGLVERVERLHRVLPDAGLRSSVGSVVRLSVRASVLERLEKELQRKEPALDQVASLVSQDIAISAKLLHVADTPFFSPPPKFLDVAGAVGFLGTSAIRFLVSEGELFRPGDEEELETISRHSSLVAALMAKLLPTEPLAFTTGLLHDIGRLLDLPAKTEPRGPGAYLLGLWGAPTAIVEAVAGQRDPEVRTDAGLGLPEALEVANGLIEELDGIPFSVPAPRVDLDRWRTVARELVEADRRR